MDAAKDYLDPNLVPSFSAGDWIFIVAMSVLIIVVLRMRTNVALAILGLCAGYFFSEIIGDQIISFIYNRGFEDTGLPLIQIIRIGLITIPALLIAYRFRDFQKGRVIYQIIPGIAFAALAMLMIVDNLTLPAQKQLFVNSDLIRSLYENRALVAAVAVLVAIIDITVIEAQRERSHRRAKKHQSKILRR